MVLKKTHFLDSIYLSVLSALVVTCVASVPLSFTPPPRTAGLVADLLTSVELLKSDQEDIPVCKHWVLFGSCVYVGGGGTCL